MTSIVDAILDFNTGRDPDGLRLKLDKLGQDPFTFLRGTNHRYHQLLAERVDAASSPRGWICGDLHLENFGSYRADDGLPHFDINDFDEACLAPLAWDVVRLLTSLRLAGAQAGLAPADLDALCQQAAGIYSHELAKAHPRWLAAETASSPVSELLLKLRARTSRRVLALRTRLHKGQRLLRRDAANLLPADDAQRDLVACVLAKRALRESSLGPVTLVDVARRLAGTGSLGQARFLALVQREGASGPDQGMHLLDVKQAAPCSLPVPRPSLWASEASRIASLQALLQAAPVGWLTAVGGARRSWVVRRLQASDSRLPPGVIRQGAKAYSHVVADLMRLAAWAHLRGAGRFGADTVDRVAAQALRKSPRWQSEWPRAATQMAALVEKDWAGYVKAKERGAFKALLKPGA